MMVWTERTQKHASISAISINAAESTASKIENSLEGIETLLKTLSSRYRDFQSKDSQTLTGLELQLREEVSLYPTALRIALADSQGDQFLNTGSEPGDIAGLPNLLDRKFYQRALTGERGLMFQGPIPAKLDSTWSILMAHPIVGRNGDFQGMVVAVLPANRLGQGFEDLKLGQQGVVTLRTEDLRQIARFPLAKRAELGIGNAVVPPEFTRIVESEVSPKQHVFEATSLVDGVRRIYVLQKLDKYPFWLTVGQGVEQYQASWQSLALTAFLICAAAFALLLYGARRLDRSQLELEEQVVERTSRLAKATESAEKAKQRLANATGAAGIGVWVWNLRDNKLVWDDRMFSLYGLEQSRTDEPVVFETWAERVHPDDLAQAESKLEEMLQGGGLYDAEFRVNRPDGGLVYIKASAFLERDAQGEISHVVGLNLDVSELRRSQQDLEEAQKLAKVGSWNLNLKTGEVIWSDVLYDIFGFNRARLAPDLTEQERLFAPESWALLTDAIEKASSTGQPYKLELEFTRNNGQRAWVLAHGERICDPDGNPVALRGTAADITALKQQELQLREARESAEAANRAKSNFLAAMSHEMRTPLNALLGLNRVLGDSELNARQRDTLSKMNLAGSALLGVINDILDLSKIESGELRLNKEPFYLSTLLKEVEDFTALMAGEKDLSIGVDFSQVSDFCLLGDAQRVRQMLVNYVSNAIKFTQRGDIGIRVKQSSEGPVQRFRFEVADTGIGIPKDLQDKLFKPFSQADSTTFRKFGGTGLGLSIVKSMAQTMGGTVGFFSVPGIGSTFWFEVPFDVAGGEEDAHLPSNTLSIVIAASDESLSSELLTQARLLGWQCWHVHSCEELQSFVLKNNARHRIIDCVLVDQRLECGHGLDVIKKLKGALPNSSLPASLIVYPNEAEGADKAEAVDSLIVRPVNPSKLFNEVNKAVLNHRPDDYSYVIKRSNLSNTGLNWLTGLKILLVDDGELNLEVTSYVLSQQGADVVCATSGQQAIDCLLDGSEPFDVVLMDVQMPVMDGNEATRQIKAMPQFADLPVIALTAGATETERRMSIDAGMVSYLTKPLDADEAIRVIRAEVETHRGKPIELSDQADLAS